MFLNGVTVKSYCVGGGVLLKKDKKLLENKLCEEVLSDLMILQRYLFTATLSTLYIVFAVLHNFFPAISTQLFFFMGYFICEETVQGT